MVNSAEAVWRLIDAIDHRFTDSSGSTARQTHITASEWGVLRDALASAPPSAPADIDRLVRELDVALNGPEGAAPQASLCDLVGQVQQAVRERGAPLLAPSAPVRVEWPAGVLSREQTMKTLREHNAWCRGARGPQTDSRLLGLALDAAIAVLDQQPAGVDERPQGYYLASFKRKQPGAVLWWGPDDKGYTPDLAQAGIYTDLSPGYHDSEHTVPVPVEFFERLRVRRVVDPGDQANSMFWTAGSLRAAIAANRHEGE